MDKTPLFHLIKKNSIFLVLLFIVSIGIYFNSLKNEFMVVDDLRGYVENQDIRDMGKSFKSMLIQPMVYSVTYHFFGLNPLPLRVMAVINHAFVSMLIFITILLLFDKKTAYIASLLFAVHPVNTETVNWISAHFYILMTTFVLLSILSHIGYRRTGNKKHLYATIGFFALFLLLFQNPWVLVIPLIIALIDFFILERGFDKPFYTHFFLLLLPFLLVYFIFKFPQAYNVRTGGETAQNGKVLANAQALIPVIESYPYSIYNIFRLYIFPKDLTVYYDGNPVTDATRVFMYIAFIIYIGVTIYLYKKKNNKAVGLLLLLPVCTAPVFSPLKVTWYITERYLYLGTGFFTTLVSLFLLWFEKKVSVKHLAYGIAGIIFILYSTRTVIRNTDWKTPKTLSLATIKTSPGTVRPYNDLAGYYVINKRIPEGKSYYIKALTIAPSIVAMQNLGYLYLLYGLDPSIKTLNRPPEELITIGLQMLKDNQPRMALYYFNEAYSSDPHNLTLLNSIARIYIEAGKPQKGFPYLKKALEFDSTHPDTLMLYGFKAFKEGNIPETIRYLETVLQLYPEHQAAKANLKYIHSLIQ